MIDPYLGKLFGLGVESLTARAVLLHAPPEPPTRLKICTPRRTSTFRVVDLSSYRTFKKTGCTAYVKVPTDVGKMCICTQSSLYHHPPGVACAHPTDRGLVSRQLCSKPAGLTNFKVTHQLSILSVFAAIRVQAIVDPISTIN
jgi:hypothetical protein